MVEDSPTDAKLVLRALRDIGREIVSTRVDSGPALTQLLSEGPWDVVLSDWSMPSFGALDALAIVQAFDPDLPFLIVSGTVGEERAVAAMRAGAHDYVIKDNLARLAPAIERELREHAERRLRKQAELDRRRVEEALARTHEQLRHAQKMEAIGRLAGGVAHDFNNLLTVILSYGTLLRESLPFSPEAIADLDEICNAGQRAAALTRQLLAFSRQQVLEPRIVDPNEIVVNMERMCTRILGENIELRAVLGPAVGEVLIDPSSLEQVIMNLVVNAHDAMPRGGKLTIETTRLDLDDDFAATHLGVVPGPHLCLSVSDDGSGMDAATMQHIFEPFFTTKEQGKGTGLGLSTVFGIVRQAGGTIWVYSEPGLGTTFKVLLPITNGTPTAKRTPRPVVDLRGTESILLVEDDDAVRAVAAGILRKHGYQVLAVGSPLEALTVSDAMLDTFHLLMTDIVMPGMSGPELAMRLRERRPNLRVLCMSGYTDEAVMRHSGLGALPRNGNPSGLWTEAGFAFLQKPLVPDALLRKVRETLA
jgi:signal transduction histidine kinase